VPKSFKLLEGIGNGGNGALIRSVSYRIVKGQGFVSPVGTDL